MESSGLRISDAGLDDVGTISTYSAAIAFSDFVFLEWLLEDGVQMYIQIDRAGLYAIWDWSTLIHLERGCEYFGWFLTWARWIVHEEFAASCLWDNHDFCEIREVVNLWDGIRRYMILGSDIWRSVNLGERIWESAYLRIWYVMLVRQSWPTFSAWICKTGYWSWGTVIFGIALTSWSAFLLFVNLWFCSWRTWVNCIFVISWIWDVMFVRQPWPPCSEWSCEFWESVVGELHRGILVLR